MVFYYQHFIPNLSSNAKPLFALTAGQKRRGKSVNDRKPQPAYHKLTAADWTKECGSAFEHMKAMLLDCVMLAHPDFDEPFILSTDASLDGLGAVLSQVPRGESKARPIAFASKTLSASQRKYPAHRLEFMALKWSVCEKFSHWLKAGVDTFDLKHLPGNKNVVADALSCDPFAKTIGERLLKEPYSTLTQEADELEEDSVQDVFRLSCQSQTLRLENHPLPRTGYDTAEIRALCQAHCAWNDTAESRALYLTQNIQQLSSGRDALPMFSAQELQLAQEQDPVISKVLPFVSARKRPSRRERHGADSKVLRLLKQWDRLEVHDGVLYRVLRDPVSKQRRSQYEFPQSLKDKALSGIHDLAGHQGQDRTLSLARQRFYWPDMEKDVRAHTGRLVDHMLSIIGLRSTYMSCVGNCDAREMCWHESRTSATQTGILLHYPERA
ncbi:Retrovirus-related Pol polyprotein from transposon 412 [Merluccius polli]|uniref:Gypsy retrotransposon integrase-like protein 1 n=1 Tax=Merluccius polli TaxID=89951 RepID=A0AA47MRP9_MERPO|nr:Retrovirus-related Pol polyprotein from transposon 412 [Merluccius polli]